MEPKKGEATPWWEWLIVILAMPALWLVIFGWRHWASWLLLGAVLGLLVWVLVRKMGRLHRLRDEVEGRGKRLPPGQFPPLS